MGVKYPDFAKCQARSEFLAKALAQKGYKPKILYGTFTPTRPRSEWDERWQKAAGNEFVHFWLAFNDLWYDYSCFQFGEGSPIKTRAGDSRYLVLGEYNWLSKETIIYGNYAIDWESYREEGGVPILRLVEVFV